VLKPSAVVELVWRDETGSTASTLLSCPSSATVEEIDASATALASILLPLTGAVLVKQRIKYISQTIPRTEPVDSTPIRRSGVFFFSTDDDLPDGMVTVPSLKEGVISATEPDAGVGIDVSNADVVAFVDALLTNGATNPFGDAFASLITAYVQSRV